MEVNPTRALRRREYGEELFGVAVLATLFSLVALAGFLVVRRYWGALGSLPGLSMRLGIVATLLALAVVRLIAVQWWGGPWFRLWKWLPFLLSPVAAVGLTVALCSWPSSSNAVCWGTLLVSEGIWTGWSVRRWVTRPLESPWRVVSTASHAALEELPPPQQVRVLPEVGGLLPAPVFQQSARSHSAEGGEVLEFYCRSVFPPAERLQTVHLAFCPPLEDVPRLTVEHFSGSPASFKVAEVQTYGARIEVRLAGVRDQPQEVVIHIHGKVD